MAIPIILLNFYIILYISSCIPIISQSGFIISSFKLRYFILCFRTTYNIPVTVLSFNYPFFYMIGKVNTGSNE